MDQTRPALRIVELGAPPAADAALPFEHDLDQVFRAHSRYVASVAMRLLGRNDEVDDVVQEVFVAALRGLRTLREPTAIRGWLATVAVRVARRRLRYRRLWSFLGLEGAPDYADLAVAATQDKALLIKRVYRILDAVPVDAKIAWTLRHVEGEPLEIVARLCGCSLATAKRRIAAAQVVLDQEADA